MESDFWHQRWHNDEIGFHQPEVNPRLIKHWPQLRLPEESRVLVPLCGKSLDLAWLARQGHQVIGAELSEVALSAFCREHGLEPVITHHGPFQHWQAGAYTFFCGDFLALTPELLGPVDAVYDRAALIALPPSMRPRYVARLRQLAGTAPQLLIALEYRQELMNGPPFAVLEDEVRGLYQAHTVIRLDETDVLADQPRFRKKGLDWLREAVYLIQS